MRRDMVAISTLYSLVSSHFGLSGGAAFAPELELSCRILLKSLNSCIFLRAWAAVFAQKVCLCCYVCCFLSCGWNVLTQIPTLTCVPTMLPTMLRILQLHQQMSTWGQISTENILLVVNNKLVIMFCVVFLFLLQNPPHPVVLAKVRGYPLWPAKVSCILQFLQFLILFIFLCVCFVVVFSPADQRNFRQVWCKIFWPTWSVRSLLFFFYWWNSFWS